MMRKNSGQSPLDHTYLYCCETAKGEAEKERNLEDHILHVISFL